MLLKTRYVSKRELDYVLYVDRHDPGTLCIRAYGKYKGSHRVLADLEYRPPIPGRQRSCYTFDLDQFGEILRRLQGQRWLWRGDSSTLRWLAVHDLVPAQPDGAQLERNLGAAPGPEVFCLESIAVRGVGTIEQQADGSCRVLLPRTLFQDHGVSFAADLLEGAGAVLQPCGEHGVVYWTAVQGPDPEQMRAQWMVRGVLCSVRYYDCAAADAQDVDLATSFGEANGATRQSLPSVYVQEFDVPPDAPLGPMTVPFDGCRNPDQIMEALQQQVKARDFTGFDPGSAPKDQLDAILRKGYAAHAHVAAQMVEAVAEAKSECVTLRAACEKLGLDYDEHIAAVEQARRAGVWIGDGTIRGACNVGVQPDRAAIDAVPPLPPMETLDQYGCRWRGPYRALTEGALLPLMFRLSQQWTDTQPGGGLAADNRLLATGETDLFVNTLALDQRWRHLSLGAVLPRRVLLRTDATATENCDQQLQRFAEEHRRVFAEMVDLWRCAGRAVTPPLNQHQHEIEALLPLVPSVNLGEMLDLTRRHTDLLAKAREKLTDRSQLWADLICPRCEAPMMQTAQPLAPAELLVPGTALLPIDRAAVCTRPTCGLLLDGRRRCQHCHQPLESLWSERRGTFLGCHIHDSGSNDA